MADKKNILVVCVDRDNDLGRKANVLGPIIGKKDNLNAAAKLGMADPGESDVNSILGAVSKFNEVKKFYENVEVVTLTGIGKSGFESDKELNEQLDKVLQKFPADGFVLVTDGAEDDQIIPILQSRAPIISKETIIVKQATEVESTYYTIKEALKDPYIARIVFGVPGIILLLVVVLGGYTLQIIALIFGLYLLLRGFGLEEKIVSTGRGFLGSFSVQRTSFPFYIGAIFVFAFGLLTLYNNYLASQETDLLIATAVAAQGMYLFLFIAILAFVFGKTLDTIHLKKAFQIRKYFLTGVSALLLWFILDSATMVFTKKADLNYFLLSIVVSFIALLIAYRISFIFDVKRRITKLLIGLPVYSKEGKWIGKVEAVNAKTKSIEFQDLKKKETIQLKSKTFVLKKGKIVLI